MKIKLSVWFSKICWVRVMNKIRLVFQWLVVLLMCALFMRALLFIFGNRSIDVNLAKDECVAILDLDGVIYSSDTLINKFEDIEDEENIKGYLLRINSPGGLVVPSQEIYEYLLTLEKPLYVSMRSVAASGGYMVALAGKRIFAMPSTTTGSIGVIMQIPNYSVLMDKIGIDYKVIKSGEYKDAGNTSREMTAEEEEYLRGIVMDMYEQFVQVVSSARDIPIDDAKAIANGKVYTGSMAKELGLVDELAPWQTALEYLKEELDNPDLKDYFVSDKQTFWAALFSKVNNFGVKEVLGQELLKPGFYFLAD
jgi:protease-4